MNIIDKILFKILSKPWVVKHIAREIRSVHVVLYGCESRVEISSTAKLNDALINVASGKVTIGEYVFFGHHVSLLTGTHDFLAKDRLRQESVPDSGRDIVLEKGVWLASNVTIIGPSVIGRNSVVAAGSVVMGDVPENVIVAGIPAKIIKTL